MSVSKVVFNLSTHPEPFGRTMIEAMSLGIPVIAWNYGGAAESLAAQFPSGLVDPHNLEKLVETTLQVLRDPKTSQQKCVPTHRYATSNSRYIQKASRNQLNPCRLILL